MADGKLVHAVIKVLEEAGQSNWCGGSSNGEGGVTAEDVWDTTNRMLS